VSGDNPGAEAGTQPEDSPGTWLTVAEAARRLGVTPKAIRNRIKHSSLESRPRGNAGREVFVPDDMEQGDDEEDSPGTLALHVQVARLEERLAASERREGELSSAVAKSEARADRLEAALAEARRPWLARVLEGLRRKGS
jgi:hypothetical protein